MDEQVYMLLARLLSFLSAFLLVLGLKFYVSGKTKRGGGYSDPRLPFTFREFYNEIKILKDTLGSGMKQLFRSKSEAIARDLKLAALPLDSTDVFGAQLLWAILFAVCGIVFMLLLEMEVSYVVTAIFIAGFTGWLIPIVQIQNLAQERPSLRFEY